jgi:hypothetical protein
VHRGRAEDDFAHKLLKTGFTQVEVLHREPLGIDDCGLYPLFSSEVIRLMRSSSRPRGTAVSRSPSWYGPTVNCEIAAVGADLQITFELRDLAETYPLLDRVRQTGATLVSLYISL